MIEQFENQSDERRTKLQRISVSGMFHGDLGSLLIHINPQQRYTTYVACNV